MSLFQSEHNRSSKAISLINVKGADIKILNADIKLMLYILKIITL